MVEQGKRQKSSGGMKKKECTLKKDREKQNKNKIHATCHMVTNVYLKYVGAFLR